MLYDPWFISLATLILTLIVQPSITSAYKYFRSRFGAFSGSYLALTKYENTDQILIEEINIKHIGDNIGGKISSYGVATVNEGVVTDIEKFQGDDAFEGFVDGRVIVGSYKTKSTRQNSSGSIVLKADSSGDIFSGSSTGYEDIFVQSGECYWVHNKIDFLKEKEEAVVTKINSIITALTLYTSREKLLETINNQWNSSYQDFTKNTNLSFYRSRLLYRGVLKTSFMRHSLKNSWNMPLTVHETENNRFFYKHSKPFNGLPSYEQYILKMLIKEYKTKTKDKNQRLIEKKKD